jgi:hypothetical protein
MLTNDQLNNHPHPLIRAHTLSIRIEQLRAELLAEETELNQIFLHCKEQGISAQDGYRIITKTSTRREIIPARFKEFFPEANEILLSKEAARLGTMLDKLTTERVLPSITVEAAKMYVGNKNLDGACSIHVTEKSKVVEDA